MVSVKGLPRLQVNLFILIASIITVGTLYFKYNFKFGKYLSIGVSNGGEKQTAPFLKAPYSPSQLLPVILNHTKVGALKLACASGHIKNLNPICDSDGCLGDLDSKPKVRTFTSLPRSKSALIAQVNVIKDMKGWGDMSIHAPLITALTDMQWLHGVYGSVGEIGVYHGRLTTILALNMDGAAGERLFVADIFKENTTKQVYKKYTNQFFKNMQKIGFSTTESDPSKRIYVWWDSSIYLRKRIIKLWDLPSFRMISIDGSHWYPEVFADFKTVACFIKDGGILVFDDFNTNWKDVTRAVVDFFGLYGTDSLVPLLMVRGKLYVTTTTFHERYKTYIKNTVAKEQTIIEITTTLFGKPMKVFSRR